MIRIHYLLSALMLVLTSCTNTHHNELEKELSGLFDSQFSSKEPGASILIKKGDEIIFSKSYGLADINTKEHITSTTLFNIGSISKTFVANVILALADEHKLSLEDDLDKYFPDFKNKEIAHHVKIHHLLTHTSGLPDNRRSLLDSVYLLTAKDEENWRPIQQNDSLLFEPGSTYEYSNPAFNALALIIEKVEAKKWQAVVNERIFSKANMPTSVITDGSFPDKDVAHAYIKTNNKFIEKDYGEEPTFAAAGNGGVWSSVLELVNYETAISKAIFLKKETIERSRTITSYTNRKDNNSPFIGYSWFLSQPQDSIKIISHTGSQGGFSSDLVSIPEKEIVYVILCNRPMPILELRKQVISILKKYNWLNK